MYHFHELKLPQIFEKTLKTLNLSKPTPIQAKAIPAALSHRDLSVYAQPGTDKTAAFAVPVITRLLKAKQKTALILVPDLIQADQVERVFKDLTVEAPELKIAVLAEGQEVESQSQLLQSRPRILIATPGRLVEHLQRGIVPLSSTEVLVLDEPDQILNLGFGQKLNEILRFLPKTRQTLLFSTAKSAQVEKLYSRLMKDPIKLEIEAEVATTYKKPVKSPTLLNKVKIKPTPALIFARGQLNGQIANA
jgi:ATP-dependent RNA helicase DeaD